MSLGQISSQSDQPFWRDGATNIQTTKQSHLQYYLDYTIVGQLR